MFVLPDAPGISLKPQHYDALLAGERLIDWLEIHPENYMGKGGAPHRYLNRIRSHYSLSMHGVGMSLGSVDGVDKDNLVRLKALVDRYEPQQVSEHLSWSHWQSIFLNDLLPLPYTLESMNVICENIDRVQTVLGRSILIENPSTYIDFVLNQYDEPEFFREIVKRSGCGILLDINNVYVSGFNNNFDPYSYIDRFPLASVAEVHLAGHERKSLSPQAEVCIDDHGSQVAQEVWQLYQYFLAAIERPVPTLIEWDTNVPQLHELLAQAEKARGYLASEISSRSLTAK